MVLVLTAFAALAVGAAAALAVPSAHKADVPPSTASFTAVDDPAWEAHGGSGNIVTIAPGGTVTFSYPTGGSSHNADFGNTPPSSCIQNSGDNTGTTPP